MSSKWDYMFFNFIYNWYNYQILFYKNYLKQFLENKLPSVEEDAAIFDLEEARKAKAQKLMGNQ